MANVRPYLLVAVTVFMAASIPMCASALPGQSIDGFKTWSAHQKLLRGIEQKTDEMSGWPRFELLTADHGISWNVTVQTDNINIRSEALGVSTAGGAPGSEPIRKDGSGYGFGFFRSLYGPAIAADYKAAKQVAFFKDPTNGTTATYYRGKLYGYDVTNGYLTLETMRAMTQDIAQMKRCAATPANCDE